MEIIAEIGQNHNGDMKLAKELIYLAKENGADVAKFQLFDAPSLFPKNKPWFDYNCMTQLSRDELEFLNKTCQEADIEFMASVFDIERLNWLEEIGVNRHKIASRSIGETELIQAIVSTGKPIIASFGMWGEDNFPVISENTDFLYCISKYPTPLEEINFSKISFDQTDKTSYTGFSDHTIGTIASCVALSRGAAVIEKHFTLDKSMEGPDHACSMEADDLKTIAIYRDNLKKCL